MTDDTTITVEFTDAAGRPLATGPRVTYWDQDDVTNVEAEIPDGWVVDWSSQIVLGPGCYRCPLVPDEHHALPATDNLTAMATLVARLGGEPRVHEAGTTSGHITVGPLEIYWDAQSGVEPGWCWRLRGDGDSLDSVAELERLLETVPEVQQ